MLFNFPKHKVGDYVWFLSKTDRQVFGRIDMITIVLKGEDGVAIYYGLIDSKHGEHTVDENQVLENRTEIRQPKFNPGDEVCYEYLDKNGKTLFATGSITALRTLIDVEEQKYEYIIEDDWDYPVEESEVLGMADSVYNDAMGD